MYAIHADDRPNVTKQAYVYFHKERHGAMVRALRFDNFPTWRTVSNTAWCRIFRENSCFSPLNLGTLFRCCVARQGTSPLNASLDTGEHEYQVG